MLPGMIEEPRVHRVEVSFVGTPPASRVERASGVSEVAVAGSILRCLVCGSFQPFIEALSGHEVVDLTSVAIASPGRRTRPAAAANDTRGWADALGGRWERPDR